MILKYYTDIEITSKAFPAIDGKQVDKSNLHTINPSHYPRIHAATRQYIEANKIRDGYAEDVLEYETYIQRATLRMNQIALPLPSQ
jgi:hypothetical protein